MEHMGRHTVCIRTLLNVHVPTTRATRPQGWTVGSLADCRVGDAQQGAVDHALEHKQSIGAAHGCTQRNHAVAFLGTCGVTID